MFHMICSSNAREEILEEFKMRDNGTVLHVGIWLILGISSTENHVHCNESHSIFSTKQGFSRGKLTAI